MFTYNLRMDCLHPYKSCQLLCPVMQHCDEQQFQTLTRTLYTIFPVIKLDLFKQALLLDYILALKKNTRTPCVHLVFI